MPRELQPLGDRILLRPDAVEDKTPSGLIIPDIAKQKPEEGVIVAVGDGRVLENGERLPLRVKPGDRVMYSKYAGADVKGDTPETSFIIIAEKDIICMVREI